MDSEENIQGKGSSKMGIHIDLNETPLPSPRETQPNDAVSAGFRVCSECKKGVLGGQQALVATEQQRNEFKCFRCLMKAPTGLDINASPPVEAENEEVVFLGTRDGGKFGSSKDFSFPNHGAISRQPHHLLEGMRYNLPATSSVETNPANIAYQLMLQQLRREGRFTTPGKESSFSGRFHPRQYSPLKDSPDGPNRVYLETLREYIAEQKGVLGEGWRVEFKYCDQSIKTSAVYVAPDGSRHNSMEDAARYLGLTSSYYHLETDIHNGVTVADKYRQKQHILRSCKKDIGISDSGSNGNDIYGDFPIQFQDFCLISAGNIDPRKSYHSNEMIWPIGYKCSWHDRITGSLFVCDVDDGGDFGPIFKVQRYPCTKQSLPVGSTCLSRTPVISGERNDKDDLAMFQSSDEDNSVITLLNEDSPPSLDNIISEVCKSQEDDSSYSDLELRPQETGKLDAVVGVSGSIGEFQVECRSTSSVWEKVSQALIYACHHTFKQKGAIKFFCGHGTHGMIHENMDSIDSLSKFNYFSGPLSNIPKLVQDENIFEVTCESLLTWLNQDRFGLDVDFVQEIIEQLPRRLACSEYKNVADRKHGSDLQTVGNGFLKVEWKTRRCQFRSGIGRDILRRDLCPPGKSLSSRLPVDLMGDVLQVWEVACRFFEVLGLGEPFSFRELESGLASPWLGSYSNELMGNTDGLLSRSESEKSNCLLMGKLIGQLLKLLGSELLSKVAVYVCPNFDVGDTKSRRGRRKDFDRLAALKKTNLEVLPINELTLHEVARRYILAVSFMEGNLDSTEIASLESGKVFTCLQGDGGMLCRSLTGIAALEGDAVVLADAVKEIFGSLKSKSETITICEKQTGVETAQTVEVNDDDIPVWAQVLEPVRKLPTNVGARIKKCVNEALENNPPEWAKIILEQSISKEVYKGNASGPTKRAVVLVLSKLTSENPPQKVEKKEKVKIKTSVADVISKQCRIVLRLAAAADEDRVFCNLLGRIILSQNDNDDEGLIGYPGTVSRPLDYRTIDLRLAAGVYDGSHDSFVDDVREVWSNIRFVYGDRVDLMRKAEILSKKFEELYEKEVQTLVQKIAESSSENGERDQLFIDINKSPLPRAPWEDRICKDCGLDRDDVNVLLCDKCDSGYHRYCLNPPLFKIPEGNWYCPTCSGQSFPSSGFYGFAVNQCRKKKRHGESTTKFLDALGQFANVMETKEFSHWRVEEKIYLVKFLFDEVLNSSTVHDHMEQSASRAADLQQKLRTLNSELKILRYREELLLSMDKGTSGVSNPRGDLHSDASSSQEINVALAQVSKGPSSLQNELSIPSQLQQNDQAHLSVRRDLQGSLLSTNELMQIDHDSQGHHSDKAADQIPDDTLKLSAIRNDISELQKSVASIDSELLKISLRKDFLGRDSNGRVYWAFHSTGSRPWIIANGSSKSKVRAPEEFSVIPDSDKWESYESEREIEGLIRWLSEANPREKELKESILQFLSNKVKDSECTEKHNLTGSDCRVDKPALLADSLSTKAYALLKKKFGPGEKQNGVIYRCQCLEILWPSKEHCPSCHQSFSNSKQLSQHALECKVAVPIPTKPSGESSSRKKLKTVAEISFPKQNDGSSSAIHRVDPDCPFKLDDIMSRFDVPNSLKDLANGIGLLGSGGVSSLLPVNQSILNDPALVLGPTKTNESTSKIMPAKLNNEAVVKIEANRSSRPEQSFTTRKNQISVIRFSKSCLVSESSRKPLEGRACEILRTLKINLLDVDAALPEDALRPSRSDQSRRFAWRSYVKSAKSIYQMIQAVITLEDSIKSEYLQPNWWYWSSPSTAAKNATLSAIALRIYALDSAISYEKPILLHSGPEVPEQACVGPKLNIPLPKIPEGDNVENTKTRSRSSKRRKESTS